MKQPFNRSLRRRARQCITRPAAHEASSRWARGAVGILLRPSPLFWTTILACLAARRPYVALDHGHPPERNAEIIRAAGLAAIITPANFDKPSAAVPATMHRITVDGTWQSCRSPHRIAPLPPAPLAPAL
jgi:acyl-CoA synthetase (AMP-forming)/AMP-acid ligase II